MTNTMTHTTLPAGVGTALVTPFAAGGAIDHEALRALVRRQHDVAFLVPVGSTGEASTLSSEERVDVVRTVASEARSNQPVVAGATSSDTRVAIESTRSMIEAGATHVMHATPMYNRPPQRGLLAHFTAVADRSTRPVLLYNVPGRTACTLEAETTLALAEHPNIIGIKEASGDLALISEILRHRPEGFRVYSGDDALTLPLVAMGADGVISVVSNVVPGEMVDLVDASASGSLDRARALHHTLTPLMDFAFIDSNPIPIKRVLAHMGVCEATVRSPLDAMVGDQERPIGSLLDAVELAREEAA
ncbi:MAG: 4-hydroxy-tetrahydrodipicolinate synthase [Gemmatimonadota bacterium]